MCGRYTTEIETDERELFRMLARAESNTPPALRALTEKQTAERISGEVFPSDAAAVLAARNPAHPADRPLPTYAAAQDGWQSDVDVYRFRWGYPVEINGKKRLLINARQERAAEKALFADCVLCSRCVIPTAGFFEWMHVNGKADPKQKFRFNLSGTGLVFLAGLYRDSITGFQPDTEEAGTSGYREFVILTREANASMAPIHSRMPVILRAEHVEEYLADTKSAMRLLEETPPMLVKRLVS